MRRVARLLAALSVALPLLLVAAPAEAALPMIHRVRGIEDAHQVITVTNRSWSSTYATLQAWERRGDGTWRSVYGPWTARVGRNGFGQPKYEGDGQTPVGTYLMTGLFGTRALSYTRFRYTVVGRDDVWVDDSGSAYYNTHQRLPADGRWRSAESLYQPVPYAHAAIVGYNPHRWAGRGSAIFLHVTTGSATAGCVSLPASQVVPLLRWLNPSKRPRIIMGPEAAVTYR
ncbi:MAG TPA: L,D-transpeptidase family protein [Frankiaceae bacterium]|nr:L,D-transpeptidase family protein [Frankiaceae bacterium]